MPRLLFFFLIISTFYYAQNGIITGSVTDARTGEILIGVNIIVNELENIGAATDVDGEFSINVPVGMYSIKASLIGFKPVIKTDIAVTSGRESHVVLTLVETSLELEQITVEADYFDQSLIENDLSTVVLSAEEVRRSPGSSQDFQRILQGMAGVSFSNDQNNELLVRGGSPNENLTVFDNIEIHSTNHYPNEFNSGGPINMINVDLIQDIQFSTGGFISKYGDKLSSVLNVSTREGTRTRDFSGNGNLSMAGYGLVAEGKINGGEGSWLLSARKSYIDLIAGSFGLTAIPFYYDLQGKVVYDLSDKHKLSLSGIYGNDRIDIDGEVDTEDASKAGVIDSVESQIINVRQYQYAAGMTLKSLWSKKFYSLLTISKNNYNNDLAVTNDFVRRQYDNSGKVISTNKITSKDMYSEVSDNGETAFKAEFVYSPEHWAELSFGGAIKFIQYTTSQNVAADSVIYDTNGDGLFETKIFRPDVLIDYKFDFFQHNKNYFFVNQKLKLLNERLILNLGLRYDTFTYSQQSNLSPRVSASYYIVPQLTSLSFAYGEYYQTQALPLYGDRYQTEVNRYLGNSHARHFVAGLEHIFDKGLKLNLEAYYKKYEDLPFSEELIHFTDRTFRSERQLNVGEKDVYGIDLQVQQKLVDNIYGTVSFSRMWSEVEDPRIGYEGNSFVSDYDFPYVFTAIIGKRFVNLRSDLDDMPFFIKYPSMVLPFSDDMEISLRWRYASGKPYTPREFVGYERHWEGNTRYSRGWWVPTADINGSRYPDYHRLDLAFNSRYNFENWNLVVFLSIQNLYNHKNIAFYIYNSDGTTDNVYQFSILPVAGLEIEF
ncbi:MAG: collagen-binding protein [Melioribacteraceae bacterium]|nr:MAG: collagen-binding protein [Melioribacteraceae bacterium]